VHRSGYLGVQLRPGACAVYCLTRRKTGAELISIFCFGARLPVVDRRRTRIRKPLQPQRIHNHQ